MRNVRISGPEWYYCLEKPGLYTLCGGDDLVQVVGEGNKNVQTIKTMLQIQLLFNVSYGVMPKWQRVNLIV